MWYLTIIEWNMPPEHVAFVEAAEAAAALRSVQRDLSREATGPWLCVLTNPRGGEAARRQGV